jgi:(S)-2-hydroxyglutarate dehydrogenase
MNPYDIAIIGGGIVGLATALAVQQRFPTSRTLLLEKETRLGQHQTGHNSGVIHSGIYYAPGSFKAEFCRAGAASMVAFCQDHGIAHEVCGKVIVATDATQLPQLEALYARGLQNQLPVSRLTPQQVQEIEPHVASVGGIRVASTGIVDYGQVAQTYARLFEALGGEVRLNARVQAWIPDGGMQRLELALPPTGYESVQAQFVINCAGLFSDRILKATGQTPPAQIVPFRGEYYELVPSKRHLVKHLIYPVPNPDFPFLGVHFTRLIDGSIHAGPNAVLGLKREGYRKTSVDWGDLAEVLTYGGFWRLVQRHGRQGAAEVVRSWSRRAFLYSLQQLIPELALADIAPIPAGVRAQALKPDGRFVEDFALVPAPGGLHVCNAPSPAATASLEIGRAIAAQVPEPTSRPQVLWGKTFKKEVDSPNL